MKLLIEEYQRVASQQHDFTDHMPTIRKFASLCESVTEFGVRHGASTRALLVENVKLRSYDIDIDPEVTELFEHAKSIGKDVEYIKANDLLIEIEQTDMLFIDTDHTYEQLSSELKLHANKANKFIAFHDTDWPCGDKLLPAILEFLVDNPQWRVCYHTRKCHGFTVLERINASVSINGTKIN